MGEASYAPEQGEDMDPGHEEGTAAGSPAQHTCHLLTGGVVQSVQLSLSHL